VVDTGKVLYLTRFMYIKLLAELFVNNFSHILFSNQPKLYVARGMYEDICSLLKYTTFWILLLICKLAFSFYVEVGMKMLSFITLGSFCLQYLSTKTTKIVTSTFSY
jgi:hypothetical protein